MANVNDDNAIADLIEGSPLKLDRSKDSDLNQGSPGQNEIGLIRTSFPQIESSNEPDQIDGQSKYQQRSIQSIPDSNQKKSSKQASQASLENGSPIPVVGEA